jgi:hypothetical protein
MAPYYNKPLHGYAREGEVYYLTQRHMSVLDALDHATSARAWPAMSCHSIRVGNDDFYGTPTRDTAFEIARLGWAEGRKLVSKARAQMPKASARVNVMEWDVAGAYPDPARAAAGAPDCMVNNGDLVECPTQVIRVVVSVSTPCTTPLNEFVNRGAAILSAIEAAELCGYPVEVEVEETSHTMGQGFSCSIVLKHAGHPADLDSLAFFLIHPSSLRRVFFALLETEHERIAMQIGYGRPARRPGSLQKPGDVYLPNFATGEFNSPAVAHTLVQRAFSAAGCAVEFPDAISSAG